MAEAVAVLGLVSSITQLVDFSNKVIHRLHEFTSAITDVPESFQSIKVQLPLFVATLQRIQAQADADHISAVAAQALRPIVDSSLAHVQTLTTILDKVALTRSASNFQKRLQGLKSLAYDKKVQKSVQQLQSNISVLVFHQTIHHTDVSEEIRQLLSQLAVAPQISASEYSFGLNLGLAPSIEDGTFVGREIELKQLQDWLSPRLAPPSQSIVTIVGTGGLGKTQLSLAFAKQYQDNYSSVFWLNARDEVSLKQSFAALWQIIFGAFDSPSMSSVTDEDHKIQQIRQWLSRHDNCKWLLLFDNYDDPNLPGMRSSTGFDIRQYFPHKSQGSILITTRSRRLAFAKPLQLRNLDDLEQSLTILGNRSRRNIRVDPDTHRLATRLDGLPLALTTAGMYLCQTTDTAGEYLEAYEEYWQELCDNAGELLEYENRTLFSTWNLSLTQVQAQDPEAAELLRLLAYFGAENIKYELFQDADASELPWLAVLVSNKRRFERAMAKLCDYSLVENWSGSYSLHTCVHDWTLQALNQNISKQYYLLAMNCVASRVRKNTEPDYWLANRALVHHAIRFEHDRLSKSIDEEALDANHFGSLHSLGILWYMQVEYSKAERMYHRALAGKENTLGPDHTSTLDTVHSLGTLYHDQDKLDEGGQMYQRALASKEKVLGPDHTSTLDTVHSLGTLYCNQGKLDEAKQMLQRSLAGKEKVLGPDHTSTLDTVRCLGTLYYDQDKLDEAEQMYQRALAGKEKVLGPDHMSTLDTVHYLGTLYRNQGKLDEAEQMCQRALAGKEKVLGPDHTSTLAVVHSLGVLYHDRGKLDEAEQVYQRALAGYEKALGPDHTSTLDVVHNLGILYLDRGKLEEAERIYQRALAGCEKVLGPDHTSTLDTVHCLGDLYHNQDKLDEAEQMYQRTLAGKEKVLGPDHTSTLAVVHSLGVLYHDRGKLDEAEQVYQRALAGYEKALGPDHTSTLETVHNLSILYRNQGKLDEAEQMLQRSLASKEDQTTRRH